MTRTALHLLNSVYSTARQRCVRKQHPKQLCLCPWPNTVLAPAPRSSSLCADTGQLPAFAGGSPSSRYGWKPCQGGKWGCAGRWEKTEGSTRPVCPLELLLLCKPAWGTSWTTVFCRENALTVPTYFAHCMTYFIRRITVLQTQLVLNAIVHVNTIVILIDNKSLHSIVKAAMSDTKTLQNL